MNDLLEISICINNKCMTKYMARHVKITKETIQSICTFNGDHKHSCPIEVKFTNYGNFTVDFDMVLRDVDQDVALFDGVS
jgi:hypothetical protein